MKKAFLSIIAAVLSFGMVLSCTDPAGPEPKEDSIEFSSQAEVAVPVDGILTNIAFTASAAWTAKLSDGAEAFVVMSPTSGAAGEGGITVQVRKNTGGEERKFSVTVTCGKVTGTVNFTQEAAASASTDVTTIEADGEGGTYELPITLNVSATITSSVDWIIVGETKAMETVTYLVKVAPNPSIEESRTGQVTVSPEGLEDIVVEVEQKKFVPVLNFVGDIPRIPQEGGTVEIAFETNMDVDLFVEGIEGVDASVEGGKIIITAPENESVAPQKLYVSLTASEYEGEGTVIAVNVLQLGLANVEWSIPIITSGVDISLNILSMALSGDKILLSDGTKVHVFNTADGAYVKNVTPDLGGASAQSVSNDDAGHIILADTYAAGTEGAKIWWANNIDSAPQVLFSFTQDVSGEMGNFRVHGDVTGSAVISAGVSISQYWAAWQITSGALDGTMLRAEYPGKTGNLWKASYAVCEPVGSVLSDGLLYGSYAARTQVWSCSNPSNNTWAALFDTGNKGNENSAALDVVNIGDKKYVLYLQAGFFNYATPVLTLYELNTISSVTKILSIDTAFYSGAASNDCYGGGDVVGVVSADGKTLEIFVCDGSKDTLAKITIPVAKL